MESSGNRPPTREEKVKGCPPPGCLSALFTSPVVTAYVFTSHVLTSHVLTSHVLISCVLTSSVLTSCFSLSPSGVGIGQVDSGPGAQANILLQHPSLGQHLPLIHQQIW